MLSATRPSSTDARGTLEPETTWPYFRYVVTPVMKRLAPSVGYGLERVPLSGGAVVAANHLSAIDHPLIGVLSPRPMHFMAKAELMEQPIVGRVLSWTGAFPVHRGTPDRAALRHACELAASGHVIAVHLEGTRQKSGHPGEFKGGALYIATSRDPRGHCGGDRDRRRGGRAPLGAGCGRRRRWLSTRDRRRRPALRAPSRRLAAG